MQAETPMESSCRLDIKEKEDEEESTSNNKEDLLPVDADRYKRIVGKLIYLSHTQPNISFVVGMVSRFTNDPREKHMQAVYRILKYLKMTPGRGIFFAKSDFKGINFIQMLTMEAHIIIRGPLLGIALLFGEI